MLPRFASKIVDDYWQERGRVGFLVWRYRLVKLPDQLDQEAEQQSTRLK
jgi:hypothetical protein